jgi:glycosyltransferase involved in cell wall biosynthesis
VSRPRGIESAVSVVVPVGSLDRDLDEALAALGAQDFESSWEIVLALNAADAEPDAVDRLLAANPRVRVVPATEVRGASYARNVGAEAASSEIIAFCDGDDIADPGWLRHLVAAVAPGRAVGGHLDESLLAIAGQENWRPPATPGDLPRFQGHPYIVSANLALYRRDFLEAGGFDLSLIRGEDIAFSWRLSRQGIELSYVPSAVIHYRHRRGLWTMLHQHYLYGRGMAQVLASEGTPADSAGRSVLGSLRPNRQLVEVWSMAQVLRRVALGWGRVAGTLQERLRR